MELAVANQHMIKGEDILITGTYDIIDNGKTIKLTKDEKANPIPLDQ